MEYQESKDCREFNSYEEYLEYLVSKDCPEFNSYEEYLEYQESKDCREFNSYEEYQKYQEELLFPEYSPIFPLRNIIIGEAFEEYTKNIFPEENFELLSQTPSAFNAGNTAEEVMRPDLLFKDRETGVLFWVECKFRTHLVDGSIEWADYKHKKRYERTRENTGFSVFIAIGIGDDPMDPDRVFILDLDRVPYTTLFKRFYEKYEIHPYGRFMSLSEVKVHCEQ